MSAPMWEVVDMGGGSEGLVNVWLVAVEYIRVEYLVGCRDDTSACAEG